MEVSEELMLTWGSHQLTLVNEVAQLRHQGCFADVTLACEGRLYLAHKFILAMCSDYFRNIFGPSGVGGSNSSLVVVLKDVACQDVEHLLDYMYTGVVAVEKSGLQSLIRTAENLQIKGLAFADSPDVSLPSPERHDPSAFVGGASRQEEVITEDHSPANSRRINSIAPDVRLNRVGSNASRVPVNSREGISPPSKRKRLQDSGGQAVSNSSNTSTTFTSNIRTSSSVSLPQMFSSKRRVSPPGGQPFFSTSSPTDVPAMPIFTEPQSPIMPPCSPLQFRQAVCSVAVPVSLASKSFRDSPERPPGSSEHHSLVSCSLPMVVSSASQPVSVMVRHSPTGCTGEGEAQRPENLEIKKEEPDGDATTGASTEILLSVDGGGPSNEASELKEEPPPEEGESGPSGLHAGLECWGAAEGGLLADAADEDEISDTDGTGVCWAEAQDKRYRCEWCGKNFRLSVHLKDHIRTHTGEKPYHCLICKKNFTQRSNLRTHLAKIHNEQLAYVKTRRRGHVSSSGIMMTAATAFSDGTTSNAQLSQTATATTPTGHLYKGVPVVRQLSEHGGECSSSVGTVNAADIGIDSIVTMRSSSMDAGMGSPTTSRKRVWSTGDDVDVVTPSSGTTVVPYLSKETLSYLYSPTDAHILQVPKLGPGGEGSDGGAGESAGVGQSCVGPAGTAGTPLTPSAPRGSAGSASAATPLNPVPLTPDPLLKTLLLKGGNQPNNLVTFDVSSFSSPSSDKSKRSLIFTSTASGSLLPNNTNGTESGGHSQACVTTVTSACHSSSLGKLVSSVKAGPSLAAVSGVDDATISATFTFHPSKQLSLPANLGVAGKDLTKSVTLMDVANKGSSTLLKLPSFMVIEASGIAPQSSSQITIPVSVPSSNEEPQQHNMEILLQAIDMKETSPAAPGKSSSCQSVPTVVSSHLPQPQLTLNLQPLQSSGNVQLAARLPGSPSRANTIHKSVSTVSPVSQIPVSLNSPLFSSFAIQRPPANNSFSSSPPILASSVLPHLPASLSMSSAAAISLPVYSLSPSCSTSNSSCLPLLTTVAPHVLTSSSSMLTNSTSPATTVMLSPPTVVSSPLLTLPPGATVLQHHTSSSGGVGECMQRRMAQIFRDMDVAGNSVTTSATLGCGSIVFTTPSHDGKTVTSPVMPDKVTVNIGGQEMTVHSSGSKPMLVEGRQKDKKVLAAMSDAMGVARFSGHHQTVASSIGVQQGGVDGAQNGNPSSFQQGGNRSGIPFTTSAVTYQQLQPGGMMAQRVLIQPQHKQQQIKKHPQNLHQPPAPQQVKQILPGLRPVQHAYQPITPHQSQQSTTSHQLQQQQRATVVSLQQQQHQQQPQSPQQHQFSTLTHEQLKRIQQQQQVQQQQLMPSRVFGNKVEAYHGVPISLVKETAIPTAIDYGVQGAGLGISNSVAVTTTNSNTSVTSTATLDNIGSGSNFTDQVTTELPSSRTN